jgi:hypothetical protein
MFQADLAQSQLIHFNYSWLWQHFLELVVIFQLILFLALFLPQVAQAGLLQWWRILPACGLLAENIH